MLRVEVELNLPGVNLQQPENWYMVDTETYSHLGPDSPEIAHRIHKLIDALIQKLQNLAQIELNVHVKLPWRNKITTELPHSLIDELVQLANEKALNRELMWKVLCDGKPIEPIEESIESPNDLQSIESSTASPPEPPSP